MDGSGDIEMQELTRSRSTARHVHKHRNASGHDSSPTLHRDSHKTLKVSASSPLPIPYRLDKAIGYNRATDKPKGMTSSLPRWLKRTVQTEEYHVESWADFHKKYSSHSYRSAHSMTFSEIRKHQRRANAKPSLTQRIVERLAGQTNKCANCGSSHCDATCSIRSASSSTTPKKKSLSPFRHKKKSGRPHSKYS